MLKGLPAAFASAAFGTFLDQKRRGDFSTAACQTVLRLITILSDSYIDTTKKSVLGSFRLLLDLSLWAKVQAMRSRCSAWCVRSCYTFTSKS